MDALRSLPGIGPYTAGAIASLAFGKDEPVLDGNVTRVLSRLFLVRGLPASPRTRKRLWDLARGLLPKGKAGAWNQALMDLGATVCAPRSPRCLSCPLIRFCKARARGEEARLPARAKSRPLPHRTLVAGVIWKGARLLIVQRPPEKLLGGLWEFPGAAPSRPGALADSLVRELRRRLGVEVRPLRPLAKVEHAYSHFRLTLYACECACLSGTPRPPDGATAKWVRPADLHRYAFGAAFRKLIRAMKAHASRAKMR